MHIGQLWGGSGASSEPATGITPGAPGQVYVTNSAGAAAWEDPAEATDPANMAELISTATTLGEEAKPRYLVDTSAGDVAVTLDLADKQAVNIRNVGENRVHIILNNGTHYDPSGATGHAESYLPANGDQLTLVNHASIYYPE